MTLRSTHSREQSPFITTDDKIIIERGGGMGIWDVIEASYKDDTSGKIDLLLRRGTQHFRTAFNRETMRVTNAGRPVTKMFRDVEAPPKAKFRPKHDVK